MDTFGFTQKKWQTLNPASQSRHLITWLGHFYRKLTTNRITPEGLRLFAAQYNEVLAWNDLQAATFPSPKDTNAWIEVISDRIQIHRLESGISPKDADLLEKATTHDKAHPVLEQRFDCHIALDGIRSLFNVGAIFRICDAAGFSSVILGNTLGKDDRRVQKTAMGAHKWVAQEKPHDLYNTLMAKKKNGYRIIGIETMNHAQPYDEVNWTEKTILVLGNEEYGISSHTLSACDDFVYLPMYGRKNSVNVACAASVICFHLSRALEKKK